MTTFTKQKIIIINGYQLSILPEIYEKIGLFQNQASGISGVILKYNDYTEFEINSAFGLIYASYLGSHTYHTTHNYICDTCKKIDDATLLKICYLLQELNLINLSPVYEILETIVQRRKAPINWYTGSLEDLNALKSLVDYDRLNELRVKYLLKKYVSANGGLERYRPRDKFPSESIETTIREICKRFVLNFDKIIAEYPEYYYANKFSESDEPIIDLMVDRYLYDKN